jgi:8-oxo-dGTP diphosphatase
MFTATLCEIVKDGKILLKKANRGVSESKWNGLGGKIEEGETPLQNVIREVKEESNLTVSKLKKHGVITFYKLSKNNVFFVVHVFSTNDFEGELKAGDEGELRWFDLDSIPYGEMWVDDPLWMPLVLEGKEFEAEFVFNESTDRILEHSIRIKPRVKG